MVKIPSIELINEAKKLIPETMNENDPSLSKVKSSIQSAITQQLNNMRETLRNDYPENNTIIIPAHSYDDVDTPLLMLSDSAKLEGLEVKEVNLINGYMEDNSKNGVSQTADEIIRNIKRAQNNEEQLTIIVVNKDIYKKLEASDNRPKKYFENVEDADLFFSTTIEGIGIKESDFKDTPSRGLFDLPQDHKENVATSLANHLYENYGKNSITQQVVITFKEKNFFTAIDALQKDGFYTDEKGNLESTIDQVTAARLNKSIQPEQTIIDAIDKNFNDNSEIIETPKAPTPVGRNR